MTLTKYQWEQYQELKNRFQVHSTSKFISLSDEENVRLKDVLILLERLGYIQRLSIDGANAYRRIGNFSDFEQWHKDRVREERKLSRRELKIAIISAVIGTAIGTVIGQLPAIISLIRG